MTARFGKRTHLRQWPPPKDSRLSQPRSCRGMTQRCLLDQRAPLEVFDPCSNPNRFVSFRLPMHRGWSAETESLASCRCTEDGQRAMSLLPTVDKRVRMWFTFIYIGTAHRCPLMGNSTDRSQRQVGCRWPTPKSSGNFSIVSPIRLI